MQLATIEALWSVLFSLEIDDFSADSVSKRLSLHFDNFEHRPM